MDAMKGGAHDCASEGAVGPVRVGVREDVEEQQHGVCAGRNRRGDAEDREWEELYGHAPGDLGDVKAERRHRTEIGIDVVNAMKPPQERTGVRCAMDPIREDVVREQREDAAHNERQRIDDGRETVTQRIGDDAHHRLYGRREHEPVDAACIQQNVCGVRAHGGVRMHGDEETILAGIMKRMLLLAFLPVVCLADVAVPASEKVVASATTRPALAVIATAGVVIIIAIAAARRKRMRG